MGAVDIGRIDGDLAGCIGWYVNDDLDSLYQGRKPKAANTPSTVAIAKSARRTHATQAKSV